MWFKNKNIFLSEDSSFGGYVSNSSLAVVAFESIGFIIVGAVMLYLSSLRSDPAFYIFVGVAVVCLAIGFHILFALVLYLARSRHR